MVIETWTVEKTHDYYLMHPSLGLRLASFANTINCKKVHWLAFDSWPVVQVYLIDAFSKHHKNSGAWTSYEKCYYSQYEANYTIPKSQNCTQRVMRT